MNELEEKMMKPKMVTKEFPGPKGKEMFRRRINAVPKGVSSKLQTIMVKAEGAVVEDIDGNRLIDFTSGIGVMNIGYSNPEVIAAVKEQVDKFFHAQIYMFGYETMIKVCERLNELTPGDFEKQTLLCNCGAEAVENAIKIARRASGRSEIVCFTNAFHGRTYMTMALTSKINPYKRGFGPLPGGVHRMESPYKYRMPAEIPEEKYIQYFIDKTEQFFIEEVCADDVAAIILEPVQGEGGFIVFPDEYIIYLRKFCDAHSIVLIADEIQSGYCRTGKMFACEYWSVFPDMVITSKSIAGGLPLASVTARKDIYEKVHVGGLGGTLNGNPVSCAAAVKVLEILERDNYSEKAMHIGEVTEKRLKALADKFDCIGEIRGKGAMQAIELVRDKTTKEPMETEVANIIHECWENGLVILDAGLRGNCIRFLMPLCITDDLIHAGMDILEKAIGKYTK
jgi:4-aminobutyrate aminotransferase/(S)-3-amino-2-methylpropionate transaminase